jgi:hypothetical protein
MNFGDSRNRQVMLLREDFGLGAADFESFAILFSDHIRSETGCEPT